MLGHPRLHLRLTDSTSDRARALAIAGAPHGTLVTASQQTAGRGRQGRRWLAPPDSALLMSLVLRGSPLPRLLPLIAAVAVCDVADRSERGEQAKIKWPNDVVFVRPSGLAKLAGILAEGRPQDGWAVLGIGLNVAVRLDELPAELREPGSERPAATLGEPSTQIEPMLARLLGALARRLSEPAQATLEDWRARDALRGRRIAWGELGGARDVEQGRARASGESHGHHHRRHPQRSGQGHASGQGSASGQGRAEGIDGEGRLVVALDTGGHTTLDAGEVHLLGA